MIELKTHTMHQWTRRLSDKAYVSKYNWQFRPTVYTRLNVIESIVIQLVSIPDIFGRDNSHSSIVVSTQSRIQRCNPAKVNTVIGDRRHSRNSSNINDPILFSSVNIGIPRSYRRYPRSNRYNITNRFPGRVSRRTFTYPKKRYHGANLWNYAYVIPTQRCGRPLGEGERVGEGWETAGGWGATQNRSQFLPTAAIYSLPAAGEFRGINRHAIFSSEKWAESVHPFALSSVQPLFAAHDISRHVDTRITFAVGAEATCGKIWPVAELDRRTFEITRRNSRDVAFEMVHPSVTT